MFEFAYFRPTNIDQNVTNNALIFTTLSLVRVFFLPKTVILFAFSLDKDYICVILMPFSYTYHLSTPASSTIA